MYTRKNHNERLCVAEKFDTIPLLGANIVRVRKTCLRCCGSSVRAVRSNRTHGVYHVCIYFCFPRSTWHVHYNSFVHNTRCTKNIRYNKKKKLSKLKKKK